MNYDLFYINEKGVLKKSKSTEFDYNTYKVEYGLYNVSTDVKKIGDSCFMYCENLDVCINNNIDSIGLAGLAGCKDIYCSTNVFNKLLKNPSVFGSYDIVHIAKTDYYLYNYPNKSLIFVSKEDLVKEFIDEDYDDYSFVELINYAKRAGGHFHELFLEDFDNDTVGAILDELDTSDNGETSLFS